MSKRFTDTAKWSDAWYRPLKPEFKLAWTYLCDNCDAAGVIDLDRDLASFQIGTEIQWDEFLEACGNRVVELPCGKLWITKFMNFQYPNGISETSKQHAPILKSIERHRIPIEDPFDTHSIGVEKVSNGYSTPIEHPSKTHSIPIRHPSNTHSTPIEDPSNGSQEKEKETDKEKETEKETAKSNSRAKPDGISAVIEHYRKYHSQSRPGEAERKKIRARLRDGYSPEQLTEAIDGCHKTPHNLGDNERGEKFLGLSLIMRDSDQVQRFIQNNHDPPKAKTSKAAKTKLEDVFPDMVESNE